MDLISITYTKTLCNVRILNIHIKKLFKHKTVNYIIDGAPKDPHDCQKCNVVQLPITDLCMNNS